MGRISRGYTAEQISILASHYAASAISRRKKIMALSRRAFLAAAALPAALAAPRIAHAQAGAGRVVIIGGGFGGASAARFARDNFPALDVTLIERSRTFTTCPYGNLVLAGRRDMNSITFGYEKLAARGVARGASKRGGGGCWREAGAPRGWGAGAL
jgi:hypothetical protein